MATAIDGLEPKRLWEYFAELSAIPRCSKHEAAASRFVFGVAKKLGLVSVVDKAGNVVVRKPGSLGGEKAPGIALQSHLDMVC
jgi:dipeptidase D